MDTCCCAEDFIVKTRRFTITIFFQGKAWKVGGDMKGDGFQNGGLLVVAPKGERVLFEFKQNNPADHAENSDILQVSV